ncbi:MAG: metallophosphoesterase [Opitutaceae bacterium]|nr:metallophosphoesterase [Opitutaceae bacterium]
MRILHCSDFHHHIPWFSWLKNTSHRYDLICLTGDLIDLFSKTSPRDQIAQIREVLSAIPTPVAICSGNHDDADGTVGTTWMREVRSNQFWSDGDVFNLKGYALRCIGWNQPLPVSGTPTEIWLVHAPPDDCTTSQERSGPNQGSFDLGEICRSGLGPRIILSGHVHLPVNWRARIEHTWSFNPGVGANRDQPNAIELNLERNIAVHTRRTAHDSVTSNPLSLT